MNRAGIAAVMPWLRWLLVPIVGIVAFYLGLIIGLLLHGIPEQLCPREAFVSGFCMTRWAAAGHAAALAIGGAIGAALMVSLPAATAPRWRFAVALLAFASGFAFVSLLTGFGSTDPVLFIAATSSGLATLALVHVRSLTP